MIAGKSRINLKRLKIERRTVAIRMTETGIVEFLDRPTADQLALYVSELYGDGSDNTTRERFVKGYVANRGKAQGIVRVVLGSKDFHKVKAGDILVTTMTSVDFVPIMGRAAAFVTNEGGITSDASIVSREMGKPCIIGTRNATQILKDGDLVEVDADKGVVRILRNRSDR